MTEETKKRLPGIIKRINELRDEVVKIHGTEMDELHAKCGEMDDATKIIAAINAEQLYSVYVWLAHAARALAEYLGGDGCNS